MRIRCQTLVALVVRWENYFEHVQHISWRVYGAFESCDVEKVCDVIYGLYQFHTCRPAMIEINVDLSLVKHQQQFIITPLIDIICYLDQYYYITSWTNSLTLYCKLNLRVYKTEKYQTWSCCWHCCGYDINGYNVSNLIWEAYHICVQCIIYGSIS